MIAISHVQQRYAQFGLRIATHVSNSSYVARIWTRPCDEKDVLQGFAIDKSITTDPTFCKAIGGTIQTLFEKDSQFHVTACIVNFSESNTGVIVGVIVGVVAVIGIAFSAFICIRRKKKKQEINDTSYYAVADQGTGIGSKIGNTGNTGNTGPTLGTQGLNNGGRFSIHLNEPVDLDVTHLRQHRLVLNDLIVSSNKLLASGAFGEVWLGMYGLNKLRLNVWKAVNKQRQVQNFIDEIILISQLDCTYIVKFIGASWTRPIEIECVVEFMDLGDLYDEWYGTYQWMAPEVINGTKYTCQADIFSFGRLRPSFDGVNVPVWVNDLAMQYLALNEENRPTALELSSNLTRFKP
ncbi:hypothetical protein THRCLA_22610 [Thraustotheca clavata]|uniref:Serine-threonine/tyrosine-protein kinase catalytic domain-containing protein n=1 Tax=Thraustotheca clavata TaxID=74557 RepID=A0A1V9YW86_9STRA|nr:hypothetical protein THRCLA_22610 [Thraustotheca clavata]